MVTSSGPTGCSKALSRMRGRTRDAQAAATDLELAAVTIERLLRGQQRSRADGCVSSRNTEDGSWMVFPLVFLSPVSERCPVVISRC